MPRRMGRPGLVGTAARTAVVVGTASAVSGGMQRRAEGQQAAAQQAAPQPAEAPQEAVPAPPEAPAEDDQVARLKQLADLNAQGILTDEEFAAAKAKVLGI
jgi:membrane protease subunit (stomatin/prohibitin family)